MTSLYHRKAHPQILTYTTAILIFALCFFASFGGAYAQTTSNGKIVGTVKDDQGISLPGVSVEAESPKMTGKISTITNETGTYRLLGLPPGQFTVRFSMEGFNTVVRENILIRLEETITLDVAMMVGTLDEEVVVLGQSPIIDVKSTAKGMTLTKDVFDVLPKNRDFSSLITTIPGVINETEMVGGISIDGASGAENMFYMDGMETSDIRGGEQSQQAAFEFIDEVQVKASGYQAEYGGSLGGVINVITRSGGNSFHGDVIGYFDSSSLSGKQRDALRLNPQDSTIAEYVNYQDINGKDKKTRIEAGFSLGGYIIRDKLWFFGAVLPVFDKTTRPIEWGASRGDYDRTNTYYNFQGKLTAQPFKNFRISASVVNNFRKERGLLPLSNASGNPDYAYDDYGFNWPNISTSVTADYIVGNNLIISARGGYFYQNQTNQLLSPDEPYYRIYKYQPDTYFYDLGWDPASMKPQGWANYNRDDVWGVNKAMYTRTSANLDVNYFLDMAGEHSIKAGFQFVRLHDDKESPNLYPVIYFLLGRDYAYLDGSQSKSGLFGYYEVRDPFAFPYKANAFSNRMALYIQDSWTIGERLTLNFGLRAEQEKIPPFTDDPKYAGKIPLNFGFGDKLAPRLGFIYNVFGDSSLKIFGSYALYYDVMKLAMPEGSYGGDQWWSTYYSLDTDQWQDIGKDGYYPGEKYEHLNWRTPSIDETDPDIKPMSQREFSFGLEKQLGANMALSVRYVNKHLIRAIEDIGFTTESGEAYIIGNPGFGLSSIRDPKYPSYPPAKREYNAVNISFEKRLSNNWLGGFSYTWSRLTGNYSGLNSADEPAGSTTSEARNDPNVNRYWDLWFQMRDSQLNLIDGALPTDRPHVFKAYGSYIFPFGLTVGAVANAYSGTPITTEVVLNGQQGYYPNNRFDTGKRTPFIFFANLYMEYGLTIGATRLLLSLNIDNLTDIKTAKRIWQIYNIDRPYLSDDEILAGADYGDYVSITDPRYLKEWWFFRPISARLGLRLSF
jgi:hypothetical protein